MECQQTALGTDRHVLQLPDDDLESTSADLVLKVEDNPEIGLRIGELIRRERHADVYSVYWYPDDYRIEDLEARAFVLDGVPGKLKRHRKRCIRHLIPRSWREESCRGAEIIVYKISNNAEMVVSEEEDIDSSKTSQSVLVPMKKTNYKQEAARTRQRGHRRRKASQEDSPETSSSPQDAEIIKDIVPLSEDLEDIFRAAVLLYIFFDNKGKKRPVEAFDVPESCRASSKFMNLYMLLFVHESPTRNNRSILSGNRWFNFDTLQQLEDLRFQFSTMNYRQLFTGVHSVLSTLPSFIQSIPCSEQ